MKKIILSALVASATLIAADSAAVYKLGLLLPANGAAIYKKQCASCHGEKGEKIAFCLNTTKEGNRLIDINTLTFVALHELSHVCTESIGHNQEFWQNFKWVLQNAKEAGIYNPIDYKKSPKEYCGMKINDNPYYDLI